MISLKTRDELKTMRENGILLAGIMQRIVASVDVGQSSGELDRLADALIREAGAIPAFRGYRGYPATICTSINEEVVHGIPTDSRRLKAGDIISIDLGLRRGGLFMDMATTVAAGEVGESARHLLRVTEEGLWQGIEQVTIGNRLSDISHAIGTYVERAGLFVVREYVGHGIGRALHEDPQIPNYGPPGQGPRLRPGMVLAIEPMVKTDPAPTRVLGDDWTVVTSTGGLSAHFEHTVALTETGIDVLTQGGD